jgi:hypothetical protein
VNNPFNDAWHRFIGDIDKIKAIVGVNRLINGIALLATHGQLQPPNQFPNCGISAYAWYPYNNNSVELFDPQNPPGLPVRFCIVAVAII